MGRGSFERTATVLIEYISSWVVCLFRCQAKSPTHSAGGHVEDPNRKRVFSVILWSHKLVRIRCMCEEFFVCSRSPCGFYYNIRVFKPKHNIQLLKFMYGNTLCTSAHVYLYIFLEKWDKSILKHKQIFFWNIQVVIKIPGQLI